MEVSMLSAINTRLLIAIVALLASIASYFAYQKHQQQVEQQKVNSAYKNMTPQQKKAVDGLSNWGKSARDQKLK
jgi:flagellar basal body-associated protein FliL